MGRILDSLKNQIEVSKMLLKDKWNQGAQEAERLKKKQKEMLRKKKKQ